MAEPRFQIGDKVHLTGIGWDTQEWDTVKRIVRVYDDGGGMTEDQWYVWPTGHSGATNGYTGDIV